MSRKRAEQRREQRRQEHQRAVARRKRATAALAKHFNPMSDAHAVAASFSAINEAMRKLGQMVQQKTLVMTSGIVSGTTASGVPLDEGPGPTFSECVVGYREWYVGSLGELRALTMGDVWQYGVNVAHCRALQHHAVPARYCGCGLYGWNDLHESYDDYGLIGLRNFGMLRVLGAIAAWGDLRVHATGFRASHACVVALAYTEQMDDRTRGVISQVADDYGVPAVPVKMLQAEAERHGTPLPAEVRPRSAERSQAGLWQIYPGRPAGKDAV